jgi:hypothetical protein
MNRKPIIPVFAALFAFLMLSAGAFALSVAVSQSGSDSDEVMKGRTFTVEAGGWSGSCTQATISFSGCSSCSLSGESELKSISEDDTSASWTTTSASQLASAQTISVIMGGGCGESGDSSSFSIVLPPTLTVSASTSASSVDAGSTFTANINIVNTGQTSANGVTMGVSGTGMSLVSCGSISSIAEGQSAAQTCVVRASTAGSRTVTFTTSASNADSASDSFSITVNSIAGDNPPGGGTPDTGGPSGGVLGNATKKKGGEVKETKWFGLHPGVGLRNNTKLLAAIEKVLDQAHMSDQAKDNLMALSAAITSAGSEMEKSFDSSGGKTTMSVRFRYKGEKMARDLMIYESIPKSMATSAAQLTIDAPGAGVVVVETDPSFLFIYPEVYPEQEVIITYSVNKEMNQSVINQTGSEVYASSLEDFVKECTTLGERRCVGNDIQVCGSNYKWSFFETCQYGCVTGVCRAQPRGMEEILDMKTLVMIGAILLIVVILLSVGLLMKKKLGQKIEKKRYKERVRPVPKLKPKYYKF